MDDHFLTVPQVAELLHVSPKTVFNMTKDGRLPARRLPGSRKYLYVRQEILDLLDEHRSPTTEGVDTATPEPTTAQAAGAPGPTSC